jgi:serine/threonine protein kinase
MRGQRLGDFEVVRELGRGGMGVVYEARQLSLNRKVALKVLAARLGLTGKAVQRFHREAEAAARLHHTNIVPVYAVGEQDGTHFYAMELIQGPSLDHVLKQLKEAGGAPTSEETPPAQPHLGQTGPHVPGVSSDSSGGLTSSSLGSGGAYFDAVARMIADVADALEHAHRQGVIHRDIKPSNLLLSPDGRLSVNDFGLAQVLEQPGLTTTGDLVGTPAYMSPEQITAGRVPVDHRTDIYSLGATLYELLTLQPPFRGPSRDQVLAQIIQKDPPRPRRLKPSVPVDLETICLKCLEKDPDRRYATAQELADDLRRYVNRFAIRAKRPGPLTRLTKWVKRNPALSVAALVILLAGGAAGYFAWHAYQSELRAQAEARQREAEKQRAVVDRGMVAAMAADLRAAQAAIAEAKALGTSSGDLHLLTGFVALYTDDIESAVREFGAAVKLMPESVAARALLSVAYGRAGNYPASDRELERAERMPAGSAEDQLFLGLAQSVFAPETGLPKMRAAVRERPSNIGRVLLADALWLNAARNSGTIADAKEALEAAETARRYLPDNRYVEVIQMYARLAAAAAYHLAGERQKGDEHLDAASGLADAPWRPRDGSRLVQARNMVAMYKDGVEPLLPCTRRLADRFPPGVEDPEVADTKVEVLWRLGEVEPARALLSKLKATDYTSLLKVTLALEQADGRPEAQKAWGAAFADRDVEPFTLMYAIPWLYLTGQPERVREMAKKLRTSGYHYRYTPEAEWEIFLQFWEEKLDEAGFLMAPLSLRVDKTWRFQILGMKRLGEGDREGARKAFTAVYESRSFYQAEWVWCISFLIRMNTDPDWPKAIPVKKKP